MKGISVQRLVADDIILRQEIAGKGLSSLGDLVISFTYDELRDFIIAYSLVGTSEGTAGSLSETLTGLKGSPVFEGAYKYVYLQARKTKHREALQACEQAEDFVEHFALNVHLLPPGIQNNEDVSRLKVILMDVSEVARFRRAAVFLLNRQYLDELLNIRILIEHLNSLDSQAHRRAVETLFSRPHDFPSRSWEKRLNGFVENVCDLGLDDILGDYSPEWLVFLLHASSLAGWYERQRVSILFNTGKREAKLQGALEIAGNRKAT